MLELSIIHHQYAPLAISTTSCSFVRLQHVELAEWRLPSFNFFHWDFGERAALDSKRGRISPYGRAFGPWHLCSLSPRKHPIGRVCSFCSGREVTPNYSPCRAKGARSGGKLLTKGSQRWPTKGQGSTLEQVEDEGATAGDQIGTRLQPHGC